MAIVGQFAWASRLTSGVPLGAWLGAQGFTLVAEAAKRALGGFAKGTHERSQLTSLSIRAPRIWCVPRCFLAVPDSTFPAGRKLDPEAGRKPNADDHESRQCRVSDSSRNALAGKFSIGPIQIAGKGLPGQINLPPAPF
jgi:hypothetical protein